MQVTRGGWTALVGMFLVLIGFAGTFVGVASVSQAVMVQVYDSWVPVGTNALMALYVLAILAPVSAGTGAYLIGIARPERDREEETLLDPLLYRPVRSPWRRMAPLLVAMVLLTAVPSLFWAPVGHDILITIPVGSCAGKTGTSTDLSIPAYALLTYSWHSSTGGPVDYVQLPSGPNVTSLVAAPIGFNSSSSGWSEVVSNGSPLEFYACNHPGLPTPGLPSSITVTGTYYTRIL